MSADEGRIAVIGAGVVGLSIACRLLHDGHRVVLVDRGEPGRDASWGNAGHIATEQVFPLASPATLRSACRYLFDRNGPLTVRPGYAGRILPWLTRFAWASRPSAFRRGSSALATLQQAAMPAIERLFDLAGICDALTRDGNLLLAETPAGRAALLADQPSLREYGVDSRWLEPGEVASMAGALAPVAGALWFPGTGHVSDPYDVCLGLFDFCRARGAHLHRLEVSRIRPHPDGGFELHGRGEDLRCARLVVAAGAWSEPLARELGHRLPLDTERGYHLDARGWQGDVPLPVASWERKTIMTPLAHGLRMTGFVEFGGLELGPSATRYQLLEQHLRALLPAAEFPPFGKWMGFRPSLPDHLPVIGGSRRHDGALFAFGHQHLGLTLAGITAEIIGDLVAGRRPSLPIDAFRPERFAGGSARQETAA